MLDLETLGKGSDSVIIAIGAVKFDPWNFCDTYDEMKAPLFWRTFYATVEPQSCIDVGMKPDGSTIMWWMKQSEEARKAIFDGNMLPIREALDKFTKYLNSCTGKPYIWGNGATFDNVIMEYAFQSCRMPYPVPYSHNFCYRTVSNIGLVDYKKEFKRYGEHHNALDDAISQALFLQKIYKRLHIARSKVDEFPYGVPA